MVIQFLKSLKTFLVVLSSRFIVSFAFPFRCCTSSTFWNLTSFKVGLHRRYPLFYALIFITLIPAEVWALSVSLYINHGLVFLFKHCLRHRECFSLYGHSWPARGALFAFSYQPTIQQTWRNSSVPSTMFT